ncbi:DNA-binding transcriptional response regulator, NtrC family, contains REC, AAA-type ATPase, and a Fis-type DNA-binding domains [Malonomonas rubra DSM 5091]|uniref:DNA-binding transcriptional response regulator, NtrC family, contains REC, AAA-type ATPase, and a Fis-type DNA-binding domains n=1 Tax=Malonomonas rubra DSM 5091 TaxID=1122189 RepID=A0A1M6IA26_MALRU|nr:sigma-54 dependent transcriptional regulator [Malonomonas rubra]SHJ31218.1 DNA-binding transcriptional response regulator, NtrC family, contains REC, AAA-type ATPase, and a Fis-type DNA-binding domains [Malonomonas rubra DSM 5091]
MKDNNLFPALPILMVDDERPWLRSLALTLKEMAGINNTIKCTDSREVMKIMAEQEVCLVLLDLTMPHLSGTDLLTMIHADHPDVPVIILSGMNQVETAVQCIKQGAFDYYVKTVEKDRLLTGIQQAFAIRQLKKENFRLKRRFLDPLSNPDVFSQFQTRNHRMRAIFQYLEAVAGSGEPILITGESGVGKELVAKAFHNLSHPNEPWVAVNAAGLDDNHFSDTLFGHTRGAFTSADKERPGMIAKAQGGTLFLDEIGDLSMQSQIKLLRLLQEGEYFPLGSDVPKMSETTFVFATNVNLEEQVNKGEFRKDLYYRLYSHHVQVPPLRDRHEDLPLLLEDFFSEAAEKLGKNPPSVPHELIGLLSTYSFPGNIRELRAMAFNAISLHKSHKLSLQSFRDAIVREKDIISSDQAESGTPLPLSNHVTFPQQMPTLEELGHQAVREAMKRAKDNQTLAASLLGITRQALSKRLQKLNSQENNSAT